MPKHDTKTTPVFSNAYREASWSLLSSLFSLLSSGIVQPENTYSCILKMTGQVWKCQKKISINTNHSYHQCSSPLASNEQKVGVSFNQPSRKKMRCEASRCNKTSTPIRYFIVTTSLEGWSTKAKEAPSPRKVRLAQLDTNTRWKPTPLDTIQYAWVVINVGIIVIVLGNGPLLHCTSFAKWVFHRCRCYIMLLAFQIFSGFRLR